MIVSTSVCELEWMRICVWSKDSCSTINFAYSKMRGFTFQSYFNPPSPQKKNSIDCSPTHINTYNMTHIQRVIWSGAHRIAKPMSTYKSKVVVKIGDFFVAFRPTFSLQRTVLSLFIRLSLSPILSFFFSFLFVVR